MVAPNGKVPMASSKSVDSMYVLAAEHEAGQLPASQTARTSEPAPKKSSGRSAAPGLFDRHVRLSYGEIPEAMIDEGLARLGRALARVC